MGGGSSFKKSNTEYLSRVDNFLNNINISRISNNKTIRINWENIKNINK